MIVGPDVLKVLDHATVDGRAVTLGEQLDRKLYARTNKVLEAAGARWDRAARAHLFEGDAAEILDAIMLTGKVVSAQQALGAFHTPPDLVRLVIERAQLARGLAVLEPSAGRGALAAAALLAGCIVDCCEIDKRSVAILTSMPFRQVAKADFLTQRPSPVYDRVLMSPPFAKGQDCAHVLHAVPFLKPGGRLVALMSAGIRFRTGLAFDEARAAAAWPGGSVEDLPDGAFRASGTGVNTALVTIVRPQEKAAPLLGRANHGWQNGGGDGAMRDSG